MAELKSVPIVALDYSTSAEALDLVRRLGDSCRFYKVGSEPVSYTHLDVYKRQTSSNATATGYAATPSATATKPLPNSTT